MSPRLRQSIHIDASGVVEIVRCVDQDQRATGERVHYQLRAEGTAVSLYADRGGGMKEKWVTNSVFCNLCGYDWQAAYDDSNTTRLECPKCHGRNRVNVIAST
jgi:hypothetical protein